MNLRLLLVFSCAAADIVDELSTNCPYRPLPSKEALPAFVDVTEIRSLVLISRHGTRYPTSAHLAKIVKLRQRLLAFDDSQLAPDLADFFRFLRNESAWSELTRGQSHVTSLGHVEMEGLGRQVCEDIKHMHSVPDIAIDAIATRVNRTQASASSFLHGLISHCRWLYPLIKSHLSVSYEPDVDILLRPFDNCPSFVAHKAEPQWQNDILRRHDPPLRAAVASLRALFASDDISPSDARALYDLCQTEASVFNSFTSCAALTPPHLSALARLDEALSWSKHGCALRAGCAKSSHLLTFIARELTSPPPPPHLTLVFAHDNTLLPLLQALGLASPGGGVPLSKIMPFAARLEFRALKNGLTVVRLNDAVVRLPAMASAEATAAVARRLRDVAALADFDAACVVA